MTTYEDAKKFRASLEAAVQEVSDKLNVFEKGNMSMTPDHVKASVEFKEIKKLFNARFERLREFNGKFVKFYAKEIREERRGR